MSKDDTDLMWDAVDRREKADERIKELLDEAIKERIAAGQEEAIAFLRKLVNWRPEMGFPREKGAYGEDPAVLAGARFCTETYLYALFGKEDARTFLCYVGGLARALGFKGYYDKKLRNREE